MFSDVILVSNYHSCKGEAMHIIPHYVIGIIYKAVKFGEIRKITNHTKHK